MNSTSVVTVAQPHFWYIDKREPWSCLLQSPRGEGGAMWGWCMVWRRRFFLMPSYPTGFGCKARLQASASVTARSCYSECARFQLWPHDAFSNQLFCNDWSHPIPITTLEGWTEILPDRRSTQGPEAKSVTPLNPLASVGRALGVI